MNRKNQITQNNFNKDHFQFENFNSIRIPRFYPRLSFFLLILLVFFIASLWLPWRQTTSGMGDVTSLKPQDRVQQIIAPVTGRVDRWYVRDGSTVKVGDKIVKLVDIDPYNIQRLQADIDAMQLRYDSNRNATVLALSNANRQKRLYGEGLASKREMEVAGINYQRAVAEQEFNRTQLIKSQATLARQNNQMVVADRNGFIVNTLASSDSKIVNAGDVLATFVPNTDDLAAEIYITGNDIPLVKVGQHVRLIFDGWPSVQFSGWPSVSIGTFPGIVKAVDYANQTNGLFRVFVVSDPNDYSWPSRNFLRMGAKCRGYIQLNQVKLGFELWRQLNGFPISVNNAQNTTQKVKGGKVNKVI